MLSVMAHSVTYVELYLRRLEVLRGLYNNRSESGSVHDASASSDRRNDPKARSEVQSSAYHGSETRTVPQSSAHAELDEDVSALEHSGLISAHVPERGVTTIDSEHGPLFVGQCRTLDSAIPQSPCASKRQQKRQQAEFCLNTTSKIPRRPIPHDALAIRSHPLAFGVIKLCQIEASAERKQKHGAGPKTEARKGSGQQQPAVSLRQIVVVPRPEPVVSGHEAGLSERELSFTDSLSLTGDFLRPPPSMYCTITSADMLLQHMDVRSLSGEK